MLGRASLVLTDSGGIQEEAPAFGVHTLVLREVTERPEGVRAGAATLVGTDADRILAEASPPTSNGRARRLSRPGTRTETAAPGSASPTSCWPS